MKLLFSFVILITIILTVGCNYKSKSLKIEKNNEPEEDIKKQLLFDAELNRNNGPKIQPIQFEKADSVTLENMNSVLLSESYYLRSVQISINMSEYRIHDPNNWRNKDYEILKESFSNLKTPFKAHLEGLKLEKENIIKKHNIDLNFCYLHNKSMTMSSIKHIDTQEVPKYGFLAKTRESYYLAHKAIFPNSNEPLIRFPICGVGFDPTPEKIDIYICEECNEARDNWVKKNVNESPKQTR